MNQSTEFQASRSGNMVALDSVNRQETAKLPSCPLVYGVPITSALSDSCQESSHQAAFLLPLQFQASEKATDTPLIIPFYRISGQLNPLSAKFA
jgi:hypothetical protein